MKTNTKWFAVLVCAGLALRASSQNTFSIRTNIESNPAFRSPKVELGPSMKGEPANWGLPVDGLQVSVAFTKKQFNQGEPIRAVVAYRNVNETPRELRAVVFPLEYVLQHGTNSVVLERPKAIHSDPDNPGATDHPLLIEHDTEARIMVRLDQLFNLQQPGDYSLQVRLPQPLPNRQWTNITSGVAAFTIIGKS